MTRPGRRIPSRLPWLATMGVGSLPGTDPTEAVRHVMTACDVPFCRPEWDVTSEQGYPAMSAPRPSCHARRVTSMRLC